MSGLKIISPESSTQQLDDIDQTLVIDSYKSTGIVLFSGFSFNKDSFGKLIKRFCTHSVRNLSPGREIVDSKQQIQTVDPGEEAFPLHPELSREPWKPDVCFFACEKAPLSGGQTIFSDGIEIVRQMPRRVRTKLFNRKLRYNLPAKRSEVEFWMKKHSPTEAELKNPPDDCPFEFIEIGGRIHRSYVTPVLHRPMFIDRPAFGNFLLFSRYLHNNRSFPTFEDGSIVADDLLEPIRKTGERLAIRRAWRIGDIAMVDNTRFMHARTAISDKRSRRILTYFGYLNFARTDRDAVSNARWRDPLWLEDAPKDILT